MTTSPVAKARLFHSLHDPARPLALANAWDVASALVSEAAGAPAVATTSAGCAWSFGTPDGNHIDRDEALVAVRRIVAAVRVPVTVDIETGHAQDADGIASTVAGVLDAGAVGINIEDGTMSPDELVARIVVARQTADRAGVPLFINARADLFLREIGAPEDRLAETIVRAARYIAAGADGIFVPGVVDPTTIATLTAAIPVPVNILVGPGAPSVAELGRLGAARASLGSDVALAAYGAMQRATRELLTSGTYDSVVGGLGYAEVDGLLAGR